MPLSRIGTVLVMLGSLGHDRLRRLALDLDGRRTSSWDGWIIAALVLWAVGGGLGQQAGEAYGAGGQERAELAAPGTTTSPELAETFGASRAFWFHIVTHRRIVLLLVIDMIWKPGA